MDKQLIACPRCGLGLRGEGRHDKPTECIDALRDLVARLQFRAEARRATAAGPERRGGRRDRKDARMVILDGQRVCLAEAARRLGLSTSALHFRLLHRTRDPQYCDVDVRAVGADARATSPS